jgi:hypothetical protein
MSSGSLGIDGDISPPPFLTLRARGNGGEAVII